LAIFSRNLKSMKCVLGFDGGGTKTECVAMDLSGAIIARGRGPASNPTRIGFDAAATGVKRAADATLTALGQPAEVLGVCAGLAGTAAQANHDRMRELLRGEFPRIFVRLCTDLDLSLAAMPEGAAMVLIIGTGSAAVGRDASGRRLRKGGYGPSGSDEGSAFDIGRCAVETARKQAADDAASELGRQILRHLGCANWAAVDAKAVANADDVYPRVFPVVAASADSGNVLAQSLLSEAARKLAALTLRLAESLGIAQQTFPLAKTGGTVGRSQFFDEALDTELKRRLPAAALSVVSAKPAETAARLALRGIAEREEARL
jgi:N-acetylglucosamine kinase-like BadF-type ATPase